MMDTTKKIDAGHPSGKGGLTPVSARDVAAQGVGDVTGLTSDKAPLLGSTDESVVGQAEHEQGSR